MALNMTREAHEAIEYTCTEAVCMTPTSCTKTFRLPTGKLQTPYETWKMLKKSQPHLQVVLAFPTRLFSPFRCWWRFFPSPNNNTTASLSSEQDKCSVAATRGLVQCLGAGRSWLANTHYQEHTAHLLNIHDVLWTGQSTGPKVYGPDITVHS